VRREERREEKRRGEREERHGKCSVVAVGSQRNQNGKSNGLKGIGSYGW
jgi:hypothetical protein